MKTPHPGNRSCVGVAIIAILVAALARNAGAATQVLAWSDAGFATVAGRNLTNVVAVASGHYHGLGLRDTGGVGTWGSDGHRHPPPDHLVDAIAVAAGAHHNLALTGRGSVVVWGWDLKGEADVPAGLPPLAAVAAGASHSVGLSRDGEVFAWGTNSMGQTSIPAGLSKVVAIAAGDHHTLAIRDNGTVVAWGSGTWGQTSVPAGLTQVVAVAAGARHSLALRADGTLVGWGDNRTGQLDIPPGLNDAIAVAAGAEHSLAIRRSGRLLAWGANGAYRATVPFWFTNVVAVAGGADGTVALLSDGPRILTAGLSDREVLAGETVLLPVRAYGAGPFRYQWSRDGVALPGATNAALTLDAVTTGHSGQYAVTISNLFGLTAAAPMTLRVLPLRITAQPLDLTSLAGAEATFSVAAEGQGPFAYQWLFDDQPLANETNSHLHLPSLRPEQQGSYSVSVSNASGQLTSAGARLAVEAFRLTGTPPNQEVLLGTEARFWVAAEGVGPFDYQWFKDGVALAGATNASLVMVGASWEAAGLYEVRVRNPFGERTPPAAVLSVGQVASWGSQAPSGNVVPLSGRGLVAISSKASQSLGLRSDGTVVAWGSNPAEPGQVPATLTNAVAIAAGGQHHLALRNDGTVLAWGENGLGQTSVPPGLSNVVQVAAGNAHSVALAADGRVVVWGDNLRGQQGVPSTLASCVAIAAGADHTLALTPHGSVVAWGRNTHGESTPPADLDNAVAVAAGRSHSLALTRDGRVRGWGANTSGQITVPAGLSNVVAIAAGGSHSLALQDDGTVVAWGTDTQGQATVPATVTGVWGIAAGESHSLAFTGEGPPHVGLLPARLEVVAGRTTCLRAPVVGAGPLQFQWFAGGTALAGQTNATLTLEGTPPGASGSYSVRVVSPGGTAWSPETALTVEPLVFERQPQDSTAFVGGSASLQVKVQSQALCSFQWRFLGSDLTGATNSTLTLTNAQFSHAGAYSVVISNTFGSRTSSEATLEVRQVAVWGTSGWPTRWIPTGLTNLTSIGAGWEHATAIRDDGTLVQWGDNTAGQCSVPLTATSCVAVAHGIRHSLALTASGHVVGWGSNREGQLDIPPELSNVVAVAAGGLHSLALRDDGTVVAWGDNSRGQARVPAGLHDVVAVSAGSQHSLALRSDRTIVAWGQNLYGQATPPAAATNVIAISAGAFHSVALAEDGRVLAWGDDNYRQRRVPPDLTNAVSIAAGQFHTVALRANDTLTIWGNSVSPPAGLTNVVAVGAGSAWSLALLGEVAPFFTSPLLDRQVLAGDPVAWRLTSSGRRPLMSQWYRNGHSIPGATNSTLTLPGLAPSDSGGFSLVLSNAFGVTSSRTASLTVLPLLLTRQPVDTTAIVGDEVRFDVTAKGTGPFAYQWRFDGADLADGTNSLLVLSAVSPAQAGEYSVRVSNLFGAVESPEARLAVIPVPPPRLLVEPVDATAVIGGMAAFSTVAEGRGPLAFQWRFNGVDLKHATNAMLHLADLTSAQAGAYAVRVSSPFGHADSRDAILTMVPVSITAQPQPATGFIGGRATLSVTAQGPGTLRYQWMRDGAVMAGATGATLHLFPLAAGDDGVYSVRVSNDLGAVTSVGAALTLSATAPWSSTITTWGDGRAGQRNVPWSLTDAVAVSAANEHNLALRADGTVVAWGGNRYGECSVPAGLSQVVAISAGYHFSVALTESGRVVVWGGLKPAELAPPAHLTNVVAISAGGSHALALTADGTVVGFGNDDFGKATPPAGLGDVVEVAAGNSYSMALRADGSVVVWGYANPGGPLVPKEVTQVARIAAAEYHGMALRASGDVVVWLEAAGTTEPLPGGLSRVAAISGGHGHFLALQSDGLLVAWGRNSEGQTNVPAGLGNVVALDAGTVHNVALSSSSAPRLVRPAPVRIGLSEGAVRLQASVVSGSPVTFQWRLDGRDIAGATNSVLNLAPADAAVPGRYSFVVSNDLAVLVSADLPVEEGPPWVVAGPGSASTFAGSPLTLSVAAQGTPPLSYYWRRNGAVLSGPVASQLHFDRVHLQDAGRYDVLVSNRFGVACSAEAILAVGNVVSWGGDRGQDTVPAGLTDAVAVASGGSHSLALTSTGGVIAWGDNGFGQTNVPASLANAVGVAAGYYHSLALEKGGTIVPWGDPVGWVDIPPDLTNVVDLAGGLAGATNHSLALRSDGTVAAWGGNTRGESAIPAGLSNVVSVAAGGHHSLALKSDGRVVGWGDDTAGQASVPVNLANIVAIAAGRAHSLAVDTRGQVFAWGANDSGQCTPPPGLSDVVAVVAGEDHSLALRADGTLCVWGSNAAGQTSVPPGLTHVLAIAAGGNSCLAIVGEPIEPPRLGSPRSAGGTWQITVPTARGRRYGLEFTESLDNPLWRPATVPPIPGDGSWRLVTDPQGGGERRFYRVRVR